MMKPTRFIAVLFLAAAATAMGQSAAFAWRDTWEFKGRDTVQTRPICILADSWKLDFSDDGGKQPTIILVDIQTGTRRALAIPRARSATRGGHSGNQGNGTFSGQGKVMLGYLIITGSHKGWSVKISQYLDLADTWRVRKFSKQPLKLSPFGTWTGQPGDTEMVLSLPEGTWKLAFTAGNAGRLAYDILDENGKSVTGGVTTRAETIQSWLGKGGDYTLRISAIDTTWKLHVAQWEK